MNWKFDFSPVTRDILGGWRWAWMSCRVHESIRSEALARFQNQCGLRLLARVPGAESFCLTTSTLTEFYRCPLNNGHRALSPPCTTVQEVQTTSEILRDLQIPLKYVT